MDRNGLRGSIVENKRVLSGAIHSGTKNFAGKVPGTLEFHYSENSAEEYIGPYDVTPQVASQTLNTAGKIMSSNVEVHGVPYFETSNTSGGSTVYIARDING